MANPLGFCVKCQGDLAVRGGVFSHCPKHGLRTGNEEAGQPCGDCGATLGNKAGAVVQCDSCGFVQPDHPAVRMAPARAPAPAPPVKLADQSMHYVRSERELITLLERRIEAMTAEHARELAALKARIDRLERQVNGAAKRKTA